MRKRRERKLSRRTKGGEEVGEKCQGGEEDFDQVHNQCLENLFEITIY